MSKTDPGFVMVLLVVNAVGLALAALPLAAAAARGGALRWTAWLGLLLAGGVFALVWGSLGTSLYGSFDPQRASGIGWLALGWPIAAAVAHVALPRRGAGVARAGASLAALSLVAVVATVVCAGAVIAGGRRDVIGSWLFPHHIGLVAAASVAALGSLTRDDRQVAAWVAMAIVIAFLFAEAVIAGAVTAL
jgi:hypothetical protein